MVASFFIDLVSEATIKLIDLEDTINISILNGHNDVVRKVTWEPSGNILVCYPALQIHECWPFTVAYRPPAVRMEKSSYGI